MSDRAPGDLELVRLFVNTHELDSGADELATAAALQAWLVEHELARGGRASSADVEAAGRLREAIRSLLLENNGVGVREDAAAVLDQAADRARLALRFDPGGSARLEPGATGVDGALGRLAAIAAAAMADGTWHRLKACRAEDCGWAFYDGARNRSRHWCSMAVCGNRTKARSYRRRHAA
ncbi:MAG TPA: CGNR zinc finger domain-containing protein [Gaiellaceae bacterium]|nr:CGNR zinc finger domain-containing protein [Gaiellaceae bacterium]